MLLLLIILPLQPILHVINLPLILLIQLVFPHTKTTDLQFQLIAMITIITIMIKVVIKNQMLLNRWNHTMIKRIDTTTTTIIINQRQKSSLILLTVVVVVTIIILTTIGRLTILL